MAWGGGVLRFLLCQRQSALRAWAPLRPMETGMVWFAVCRTREAYVAWFALHPSLSLAEASFSKNLIFYVWFVTSKYTLPPPMTQARSITAAWWSSTASSSRRFTAAMQRLGVTQRCFCWASRLQSQEGPQENAPFKCHTQEPMVWQKLLFASVNRWAGTKGMQIKWGLLNSCQDKWALSSPVSHPGSRLSRSKCCVTGRRFGFIATIQVFRTAHPTQMWGGGKFHAVHCWLTGHSRAGWHFLTPVKKQPDTAEQRSCQWPEGFDPYIRSSSSTLPPSPSHLWRQAK